jgi:menaquinone-9 beta-reductase
MSDADVIVVGFRCAGAPLAYALHRAGVKVIAVEKDPLFSDQPISTHAIQPYGMRMFDRIGLGDTVRRLAPPNSAFRFQVEDSYMQIDLDGVARDSRSPRRSILDPALQKAALEAGVEARERTRVVGLVREGERVAGVRVRNGAGEHEIRARLLVGADGRRSTIAQLVGAETYLESRSPHGLYWSYFEKTPVFDTDPRYDWGACIHIEGRGARAVFQTDSDLLLMAGGGRREEIKSWRTDPRDHLIRHLAAGSLTAPLLEGSRMVGKPIGQIAMSFFMKRAVGPGWALVGDSGLHIDPTPGLGISDAVRDALALADAVVDGSERAMRLFWRRRDAESIGLYHFAGDMGSEDYNNPMTRMLFRRLQNDPVVRARMYRMMDRDLRPQEAIPPAKVLGWLLAESLAGRLAPWRHLPRTLRFGRTIDRQQRVLDLALERAERGDVDDRLPSL